jgi:GntR family transcriptional regulator/MocR family aminotransferase
MPKRSRSQDVSLGLRPQTGLVSKWLYEQLRSAILEERLSSGTQLPSSRDLASQYAVSRGSVVESFERLRAEGYVVSKVGAGTFVSTSLPVQKFLALRNPTTPAVRKTSSRLSARGRLMARTCFPQEPAAQVGAPFRAYQPDLEAFPFPLWSRIAARRQRLAHRELLGAGDPRGYRPLREAVVAYLATARGVVCDADQILILSSVQQALDLAARILLDPNDPVWIEDPGYPGARLILEAAGARLISVPVDTHGMNVDAGRHACPLARLAYVTPAHQVPLGGRLSLERRFALLEWSYQQDSWIFEDDYDSEFRYDGSPFAALKALDSGGSVLYAGSFSKMLFPSLRLAYLVVPSGLVDSFAAARSLVDRFPPLLGQAVLCDFIAEGHFARHLRSMRDLYGSRLIALREGIGALSGLIELAPEDAGLEIVGWLSAGIDDQAAATAAAGHGVEVRPISPYAIEQRVRSGLVLGFAAVNTTEIKNGLSLLHKALRSLQVE